MTDISASSPAELPPASAPPPSSRGIIWLLTGLTSSIVAAIAITLIGVWVFPPFSDTFTAFSLSATSCRCSRA